MQIYAIVATIKEKALHRSLPAAVRAIKSKFLLNVGDG